REAESFRNDSAVHVVPTIFFKQAHGQLEELVDVFVRHVGPASNSTVELTIGGKTYREPISGGGAFGESKLEFEIPEFPAGTKAKVTWSERSKANHYQTTLTPQKKWTLYLVPHIHLDVGYSDYQAKIAAIHSHVIDEAMEMIAAHPDFRFSLDGSWPRQQFMETRAPAQQQRAIAA